MRQVLCPHTGAACPYLFSEAVLTLGKQTVPLATKEAEAVLLVAQGLSNKEIASRQNCAEATVKNRLTNCFNKLGVNSRVELIVQVLGNQVLFKE